MEARAENANVIAGFEGVVRLGIGGVALQAFFLIMGRTPYIRCVNTLPF